MKRILQNYGLKVDDDSLQDKLDQVADYIKELFPKIPDDDLRQVVDHAWKQNSNRVGTNKTMSLPDKVQLAVIARIRHKYTDYDILLKSFDWATARKTIEPYCVQKLMEWRGEDAMDKQEMAFEEAVKDVIVIDSDDEDAAGRKKENAIPIDDDDESMEDSDSSDESVEVVAMEDASGHVSA